MRIKRNIVLIVLFAALCPSHGFAVERPAPASGYFEEELSAAEAEMLKSLRLMRRSRFYGKLSGIVDKGDLKTAERLLRQRLREAPSDKDTAAYLVAQIRIAYAKKNYQAAYDGADNFISKLEEAFAPRRPYEVDFADKAGRDSVQHAYILRYQAAAALLRYEDALADLDRAQTLGVKPELLRAKTGALLALGRYAEAAAAADGAYELDKKVFENSPYKNHYCWLFSEHGYNDVKYCGYFAALAKERAAAQNSR